MFSFYNITNTVRLFIRVLCFSLKRRPYIFLSHAHSFQKNSRITFIVRDIHHTSMIQHKVHILFVRLGTKDNLSYRIILQLREIFHEKYLLYFKDCNNHVRWTAVFRKSHIFRSTYSRI